MTDAGLRDHLGEDFAVRPLKRRAPVVARWARALRLDGGRAQPRPFLLETASGRRFKMLHGGGAFRTIVIDHCAEAFGDLAFVPRLLWRGPESVLVDYVDGAPPDTASPVFATAFGRALAQVHQRDVDALPRAALMHVARRYCGDLEAYGVLPAAMATAVQDHLEALLPERVRTSLVYADLQDRNFVMTPDGRLVFIDLGAFQRGRPTDHFLLGHRLMNRLDRPAFETAYLQAGGWDGLFDHERAWRYYNDLRVAAVYARMRAATPAFEIRRRAAFGRWLQAPRQRLLDGLRDGA